MLKEDEDHESSSSETSCEGTSETQLHTLFAKYNVQQQELERVEKQNNDYRDQLIRTIRERDLNADLLKNVRQEQCTKLEEQDRKILEYESQLRLLKTRATAQEAHYQTTTKDLTQKFESQVMQLTKKSDIAEKEKNEAVIKYAMKETEIMRLKQQLNKKEEECKQLLKECEELKTSTDHSRLKELETTIMNVNTEVERQKHEKFDFENRYKLAEKRVEALQLSLTDQKQQNDVLRRQMLQLKEEKSSVQDQFQRLLDKTEIAEQQKTVEEVQASKANQEREEIYRNVVDEVGRTKQRNVELEESLEELSRENAKILIELRELEDTREKEAEVQRRIETRLKDLEGIENKVNKSLDEAKKSKVAQEEAESDRKTAEMEADECRKQAERMLEITEELTRRNTQLGAELEKYREQSSEQQQKLIELEGTLKRSQSRISDLEKDKQINDGSLSTEMDVLSKELSDKVSKIHELQRAYDEEKNQHFIFRKKATSNIKELKTEVSILRRQCKEKESALGAEHIELPLINTPTAPSSSSRTSSITSIDQIGRTQDSMSCQSPVEEAPPGVQQAMVEKIVKLQKQLARRTEKIEFLEEHVRQCLDELQKKTKLIQYYALREEASLLLPADNGINKVPLLKKGSTYSLMGSMWTSGADKKTTLQLATEVNSRLQAVLEDTLLKNIALKTSVDTLGEEISRLSRENRQLTLKR